jgi:hypothetical protein
MKSQSLRSLEKYLNTHSFYSVDEFFMHKDNVL